MPAHQDLQVASHETKYSNKQRPQASGCDVSVLHRRPPPLAMHAANSWPGPTCLPPTPIITTKHRYAPAPRVALALSAPLFCHLQVPLLPPPLQRQPGQVRVQKTPAPPPATHSARAALSALHVPTSSPHPRPCPHHPVPLGLSRNQDPPWPPAQAPQAVGS